MNASDKKFTKTSKINSTKKKTSSAPQKEEFEGMRALRVKETHLKLDSNSNIPNNNFCKNKNITEVPLDIVIEQTSSLEIPKIVNSDTLKVSLNVLNKKPVCDVYSDFLRDGGFAGTDAWIDLKEFYYIPGGMSTELFEKNDFSASEYVDRKIFEEKFFENSKILFFKYFFYDYSDDSYSTNEYDIYFESLINNLVYRYHVYSREDVKRKLVCFYEGKLYLGFIKYFLIFNYG